MPSCRGLSLNPPRSLRPQRLVIREPICGELWSLLSQAAATTPTATAAVAAARVSYELCGCLLEERLIEISLLGTQDVSANPHPKGGQLHISSSLYFGPPQETYVQDLQQKQQQQQQQQLTTEAAAAKAAAEARANSSNNTTQLRAEAAEEKH